MLCLRTFGGTEAFTITSTNVTLAPVRMQRGRGSGVGVRGPRQYPPLFPLGRPCAGLARPSTPLGVRNKDVDTRDKPAQDDFTWSNTEFGHGMLEAGISPDSPALARERLTSTQGPGTRTSNAGAKESAAGRFRSPAAGSQRRSPSPPIDPIRSKPSGHAVAFDGSRVEFDAEPGALRQPDHAVGVGPDRLLQQLVAQPVRVLVKFQHQPVRDRGGEMQ